MFWRANVGIFNELNKCFTFFYTSFQLIKPKLVIKALCL